MNRQIKVSRILGVQYSVNGKIVEAYANHVSSDDEITTQEFIALQRFIKEQRGLRVQSSIYGV